MTKRAYTIIPQRHNGKTWAMAGEHNATGWLVVSASGKHLARYASKASAAQYVRGLGKPKAASPTLGGRMPAPRPKAPIASSFTRAEYDSLIREGKL